MQSWIAGHPKSLVDEGWQWCHTVYHELWIHQNLDDYCMSKGSLLDTPHGAVDALELVQFDALADMPPPIPAGIVSLTQGKGKFLQRWGLAENSGKSKRRFTPLTSSALWDSSDVDSQFEEVRRLGFIVLSDRVVVSSRKGTKGFFGGGSIGDLAGLGMVVQDFFLEHNVLPCPACEGALQPTAHFGSGRFPESRTGFLVLAIPCQIPEEADPQEIITFFNTDRFIVDGELISVTDVSAVKKFVDPWVVIQSWSLGESFPSKAREDEIIAIAKEQRVPAELFFFASRKERGESIGALINGFSCVACERFFEVSNLGDLSPRLNGVIREELTRMSLNQLLSLPGIQKLAETDSPLSSLAVQLTHAGLGNTPLNRKIRELSSEETAGWQTFVIEMLNVQNTMVALPPCWTHGDSRAQARILASTTPFASRGVFFGSWFPASHGEPSVQRGVSSEIIGNNSELLSLEPALTFPSGITSITLSPGIVMSLCGGVSSGKTRLLAAIAQTLGVGTVVGKATTGRFSRILWLHDVPAPEISVGECSGISRELEAIFLRTFEARIRGLDARALYRESGIQVAGMTLRELSMQTMESLLDTLSSERPFIRSAQRLVRLGFGDCMPLFPVRLLYSGELHRLALARELASSSYARTKKQWLFLLDAPLEGLGGRDAEEVVRLFREIASRGHTVVYTERCGHLACLADSVVRLGLGSS